MERLNEQQAKQIIMNAQMASYPARDVPLILKPLYGYVEDTEKEIAALKAENEQLRAEQERFECAHEEMTYIIQKAAHRRCDYCILRTEPCPARGLNAECSFEYAGLEESTCGACMSGADMGREEQP